MNAKDKKGKTPMRPARTPRGGVRHASPRQQQQELGQPASTLFAGLNHDVRTPLTGIIGMLNLLLGREA